MGYITNYINKYNKMQTYCDHIFYFGSKIFCGFHSNSEVLSVQRVLFKVHIKQK